jgi:nitroreductase
MQDHFHEQPPCGKRGDRYVLLESGAIAQNVHLLATALELGAVLVGGFDDNMVTRALDLPRNIKPTALICIGAKNSTHA